MQINMMIPLCTISSDASHKKIVSFLMTIGLGDQAVNWVRLPRLLFMN